MSVVRDPLRETGRSGLFLIAALVFALAAAARILWPDAILSGTVNALGTVQRFASALGAGGSKIYAELGSLLTLITGIGDLTSVLSGLGLNLTGVKIAYYAGVFLAVLPDLIAFAGLLAVYARSRKGLGKSGGRATGNVRGCLTVIQTAEILGFLFLTVSALAFGFTCLAEGLRNGAARMQRAGFAAFLACAGLALQRYRKTPAALTETVTVVIPKGAGRVRVGEILAEKGLVKNDWRYFAWLREPRRFNWFCLIAFSSVLMTYFGVNLLFGGMHSYAG